MSISKNCKNKSSFNKYNFPQHLDARTTVQKHKYLDYFVRSRLEKIAIMDGCINTIMRHQKS